MRIADKVNVIPWQGGEGIVIRIPSPILEEARGLHGVACVIDISKERKKRSLDANAYCWVLIQMIATKIGASKEDVYRKAIREMGSFTVLPIKEEAVDRFTQIWQAHGIGWICEVLGKCKHTVGYVNVLAYHGSSTYDTKEMARLIDSLITEAKELGIEVISESEKDLLIKEWNK